MCGTPLAEKQGMLSVMAVYDGDFRDVDRCVAYDSKTSSIETLLKEN